MMSRSHTPSTLLWALVALFAVAAVGCAESGPPPAFDTGNYVSGEDGMSGSDADDSDCPPDSCQVGESRCAGNRAVVHCRAGADGCGTFGQPMECSPPNTCRRGRCVNASSCVDQDGDGYGDKCPQGPDCDDSDPAINPGAEETCGDQVDNNCQNGVDEGCGPDCSNQPCTPGATRCAGGGQVEVCRPDMDGCGAWSGSMACPSGSCQGGQCSSCTDQDGDGYGKNCPAGPDCDDSDPKINPGAREKCDRIDNDCDGQTDEDYQNLGSSCQKGQGECRSSGTTVCSIGGLSTMCDAQPGQPEVEMCGDNRDNDCDGQVDEGFGIVGMSCTRGSGSCQTSGKIECDPNDPTQTRCSAPSPSTNGIAEICDGEDNDCDGQTDESGVCNTCTEDRLEPNQQSTSGANLTSAKRIEHIVSCGRCGSGNWDWDWFRLGTHSPGTSITVELQHPTGTSPSGGQYADLDVEFWCNSKLCNAIRGSAGTTSKTFDGTCGGSSSCAANSTWTFHVYPRCSANPNGNPTGGTPYTVIRR